MRKGFRKFIAIAAAAVMTAGALSLAACGTEFQTPAGMPADTEPVSNGGFIVEKGEYYYFINGMESTSADNTYGTPVKGALYRIKKADVQAKKGNAERVVPSIIADGTYTGGFYIYGDRVYYATPNNVPDPVSGELDSSVMRFCSAKLDGSDVKDHFTLEAASDDYRIVEVGDTVYVLYSDSNDLYSYNMMSGAKTLLADNTTSIVFNEQDLTDPTVYYTMSVSEFMDSDKQSPQFAYNQVYTVKADATEEPYDYHWDEGYINDKLNGEKPYTNLGVLILDGRASNDVETRFNHSATAPQGLQGHRYELRAYTNGGLYYTDKPAKTADGSVGSNDNGMLYFIDAAKFPTDLKTWDSVKVNEQGQKDTVADASQLTQTATSSALFYRDSENGHHYLYIKNNAIYRADVAEDGSHSGKDVMIADSVSGATLISVDLTTDPDYQYVYFTRSNGAGHSVERAVINGEEDDYRQFPYTDPASGTQADTSYFTPAKVLNLEVPDSWFQYELIGTTLFFADADNDIASTSFNYISVVSLANAEGKLMNNKELQEFTDDYNSIMSTDSKVGLLEKIKTTKSTKLSTALRYYFMTGETAQFYENIKYAVEEANRTETYYYDEDEQNAFKAFTENKGYTDKDGKEYFKETDGAKDGKAFRTYSSFVTKIGEVTEADAEKVSDYWRTTLEGEPIPEEVVEESGLPAWAWALIGIAIGVVVIGTVVAVVLIVRKKKGGDEAQEEKMAVDTTDDRDVDVYAVEPEEETEASEEADEEVPAEETPAEEPAEEVPAEPQEEAEGEKEEGAEPPQE